MAVGAILWLSFRDLWRFVHFVRKEVSLGTHLLVPLVFLFSLKVWHYCFGGPQTRSFPPDYIGGLIDLELSKISMVQIIGLGVSVVLMLILNIVIKKTKIGKAIRACIHEYRNGSSFGY